MTRGRKLLTRRQDEVLRYIAQYRAANGYSPTHDEVAAHVGITQSRAHTIAMALIRKGYLRRTTKATRNLIVIERGTA